MSTKRSVGRITATQEKTALRPPIKRDRSGLCAFTFADGRQCSHCRSRAAPATAISVISHAKRKRNPKPPDRLVRLYLPSSLAITYPHAISVLPRRFSLLSRRSPQTQSRHRLAISARLSTNPSNSPGRIRQRFLGVMSGAERVARASNHRRVLPSPFPARPNPSNRHLTPALPPASKPDSSDSSK